MRRGMYRVRGKDGLPNDVRVEDDGISVPLEEALYVSRGYQPGIADLPWEEDYIAPKPAPEPQKAAREPLTLRNLDGSLGGGGGSRRR